MAKIIDLFNEINDHEKTLRCLMMEQGADVTDKQGIRVLYEIDETNGLVRDIRINLNVIDKGLETEEAWFESKPPYMIEIGVFRVELKAKIAEISSSQGIINYTIIILSEEKKDAEVEAIKEVDSKIVKINYYANKDGENINFTEMA